MKKLWLVSGIKSVFNSTFSDLEIINRSRFQFFFFAYLVSSLFSLALCLFFQRFVVQLMGLEHLFYTSDYWLESLQISALYTQVINFLVLIWFVPMVSEREINLNSLKKHLTLNSIGFYLMSVFLVLIFSVFAVAEIYQVQENDNILSGIISLTSSYGWKAQLAFWFENILFYFAILVQVILVFMFLMKKFGKSVNYFTSLKSWKKLLILLLLTFLLGESFTALLTFSNRLILNLVYVVLPFPLIPIVVSTILSCLLGAIQFQIVTFATYHTIHIDEQVKPKVETTDLLDN